MCLFHLKQRSLTITMPSFVSNFSLSSLVLVFFCHRAVFALTLSPLSLSLLCRMISPTACFVSSQCWRLTLCILQWLPEGGKKKKKVQEAKDVLRESLLCSKKESVRETFWQREQRRWEQCVTLQILGFTGAVCALNVISKTGGTGMVTWYHAICSELDLCVITKCILYKQYIFLYKLQI